MDSYETELELKLLVSSELEKNEMINRLLERLSLESIDGLNMIIDRIVAHQCNLVEEENREKENP